VVLCVSPNAPAIFGYEPDNLIGEQFWEHIDNSREEIEDIRENVEQ
jgi:hypothetical protein